MRIAHTPARVWGRSMWLSLSRSNVLFWCEAIYNVSWSAKPLSVEHHCLHVIVYHNNNRIFLRTRSTRCSRSARKVSVTFSSAFNFASTCAASWCEAIYVSPKNKKRIRKAGMGSNRKINKINNKITITKATRKTKNNNNHKKHRTLIITPKTMDTRTPSLSHTPNKTISSHN